jgi:hypothetical protein
MKYRELFESDHFQVFIDGMFDLYNGLARQLGTNRQYVIGSCRRAIRVLRNYHPKDDGEEVLIEAALDSFIELLQRAGGQP